MAYTYEEVMSLLGDEAQAVPGAIVVFRAPVGQVVPKHIDVARITLERGFVVTDEGLAILNELKGAAAPEAPKTTRKSKKVVESANTSVSEADDLDLSV